jgi:hypothetical protein
LGIRRSFAKCCTFPVVTNSHSLELAHRSLWSYPLQAVWEWGQELDALVSKVSMELTTCSLIDSRRIVAHDICDIRDGNTSSNCVVFMLSNVLFWFFGSPNPSTSDRDPKPLSFDTHAFPLSARFVWWIRARDVPTVDIRFLDQFDWLQGWKRIHEWNITLRTASVGCY